jgi:hypothetical protein
MPVSKVARLPHLPPPVLTAYLDVNPSNPRDQSTPRGYLKRLKSAGQALGHEVAPGARKALRAQIRRIIHHLARVRPRSRALVLFSGPHVWEKIPLHAQHRENLETRRIYRVSSMRAKSSELLSGVSRLIAEFGLMRAN